MKGKIIIWDIDIIWVEDLKSKLQSRGYLCEEVDDKEEFFESLQVVENPILCILSKETMEEFHCNPMEIIREEQRRYHIPAVLISEEDSTDWEIEGIHAGAVEVLFKNRTTRVAEERIISLLDGSRAEWFRNGKEHLMQEPDGKEIFAGIHFSATEQKVLSALYEGKIVRRETLVKKYWADRENKGNRVVDTVVKQLRKKIQNTGYEIKSIYGEGYQLRKIKK